jgi:PTS system nitrogen regulatory IIA component
LRNITLYAKDANKIRETIMNFSEIMTVEEVAELVRVSERTVYDWAKKGEIPCGKLGSIWRFKRSDVTRWVNEQLGTASKDFYTPPISLEKILNPQRIVFEKETSKVRVLNNLVDILAETPEVGDREELRKGIFHREELMSTGIGLGIAIPHVRLASIKDVVMAAAICPEGVTEYESLDNVTVKLVFMIAAGATQHAEHIKLLSFITSRLKNKIFLDSLLGATDADTFYNRLLGRS